MQVELDEFERIAGEALDLIPEELGEYIENVIVVVDDKTPPGNILGLYEGRPLTTRAEYGQFDIQGTLPTPDRITLYKQSIEVRCRTSAELRHQIAVTVIHEIGHHFGIDDKRLHELGWA